MAKRDQCCARCGERFESTRPTVHEVIANSVSALLLSAILLPLVWKLNQTAEHLCHRFAQHLLWREPVEDWNRSVSTFRPSYSKHPPEPVAGRSLSSVGCNAS
jgi:hypothetical protein